MKRADMVLAMRRIDPGLAANGTVDLRQKRGRNLHEPNAASQNCRSKPGQIADDATAKGHDHIATLYLFCQQPFNTA